MSDLRALLGNYLTVRRALGTGLRRDEKLLRQFLDYLDQQGIQVITVAAAVDWVRLPGEVSQGWLGMRMRAVRAFAGFCRSLDGITEVPPRGVLSGYGQRATPYLYTDEEIDALCNAALNLRGPVRTLTYQALVRLLAATGMRLGEAVSLDANDFDPLAATLTVRDAKFGRTRLLPLHPSSVEALTEYRARIAAALPHRSTNALLVSTVGTRLREGNVGATFRALTRIAGLTPRSATCRPRPHDLRHSFAVRTLIDWYRDGHPIDARMPLLSAYLGHSTPANTYWYLNAAPELMALAARRLELHKGHQIP